MREETVTVPLDMVHAPGSFVLRLANDAPRWHMAKGDYLVIRPQSSPRHACVTGAYIVTETHEGAQRFLRRVRLAYGGHIELETPSGECSTYNTAYPRLSVVGVLSGIIRKY